MSEKEIAEKVVDLLSKQRFATWYEKGDFDKWITGSSMSIVKEDIVEQLQKMLFPK